MLYSEIEDILAKRLGNRTNIDSIITTECKLAQETLELNFPADPMPWFLVNTLRVDLDGYTTDLFSYNSTNHIDATGFIRLTDDGFATTALESDSTKFYRIKRLLEEEVFDYLYDDDTGALVDASNPPQFFSMNGSALYIYPPTDGEHNFYFRSYFKDTSWGVNDADGVGQNKWSKYAPKIIIGEAGIALATFTQNDKLIAAFTRERDTALDRLVKASVARESAMLEGEMGGA